MASLSQAVPLAQAIEAAEMHGGRLSTSSEARYFNKLVHEGLLEIDCRTPYWTSPANSNAGVAPIHYFGPGSQTDCGGSSKFPALIVRDNPEP